MHIGKCHEQLNHPVRELQGGRKRIRMKNKKERTMPRLKSKFKLKKVPKLKLKSMPKFFNQFLKDRKGLKVLYLQWDRHDLP